MANSVMNSVMKDWSTQSTTFAGYPEMSGYQPTSAQARNPYTGAANPYGTQQGVDYSGQPVYSAAQAGAGGYPVSSSCEEQMASYEVMMNVPMTDVVDRGMMTYDDVVVKSPICFGLLLMGATAGWLTGIMTLGAAMLVAPGACVVTLGLGLLVRFSKTVRLAVIIAYSLVGGLVLGALSFAFELMCPGIVITVVVMILVVTGVTLAAFTIGFVHNSLAFARVAGIGRTASFSYYMASSTLSVTGLVDMTAVNNAKILGISLGIITGVLAVFTGVLCLVRDFDTAKVGVANSVPERYSWLCTFVIITDVTWIYLEIFKILFYLMRRD